MYVGRTRLDAATLDRFVMATIAIDYDAKLERSILAGVADKAKRDAFSSLVRGWRRAIKGNRLLKVCSTRAVINGSKLLNAGFSVEQVAERFFASMNWTDNERRLVTKED